MLTSLTINNVVLIDGLSVGFEGGLCALTGETGAGKSILLDALGLALGARSESTLVRAREKQANVGAVFELPSDHPAFSFLADHGLESSPFMILRRSVQADGKSRAFVNDQPVSVSLLKQLGEMLVEIHGQFATHALLNPREHRQILDDYARCGGLRSDIAKAWNAWQEAKQRLTVRQETLEKARAEETYLRGALEQLEDLSPLHEGEEEKLASLRARLMKKDQILETLSVAEQGVEEGMRALSSVYRALERVAEDVQPVLAAIDRAHVEMQEAFSQVQDLAVDLQDSEGSLVEIDERLFSLRTQARKHGCRVDDLPQKLSELRRLLTEMGGEQSTLEDMEREITLKREAYVSLTKDLSDKRRKAASAMDRLVAAELAPLKLEKARFETSFSDLAEKDWGPEGIDDVQFLVATNPGAQAGPLHKIASGGEMARFMLALKVVMAGVGPAQTLVFDEVDSGVGGATASAVGERLAALCAQKQVLVVTHSPQVAAQASQHCVVLKTGHTNPTTKVLVLETPEERQEEIARMLSGAEITKEARAAAARLLEGKKR